MNIYRINQCKLPISHTEEQLKQAIRKAMHLQSHTKFTYEIIKRSLDARKKEELLYSYMIDVHMQGTIPLHKQTNIRQLHGPQEYSFRPSGNKCLINPPVIVGMGPAGLFCAYMLAKEGYAPIVLERGDCVEERQKKVNHFWQTRELDTESNVQFGEGGAGTFSDGKLNTLVKDKFFRNREVLKTFVKFGAPEEILYENKPHIGTDVLSVVVKNMRNEIIRLGGMIRFRTKFVDYETDGNTLQAIIAEHEGMIERIPCNTLVLAIGHSARDTFEILRNKGLAMEAKAFAVGVRILHPQKMISESQYGAIGAKLLPPASYKLTGQTSDGRGIYSFCMCPGGYVVNASSEKEHLAVNGMSYHARASESANSALIITVSPNDFPGEISDPLRGIAFQRKLESLMYREGNGAIPVQLFGDFKQGRESKQFYDVIPCFCGETAFLRLDKILPKYMTKGLNEGITHFGQIIRGFDRDDAILAGIESRTSSPVRIHRDENGEAAIRGIYPCGEGAGYAGGITSAAMDGMRIYEVISSRFARPNC